ncbi:MAG: N-acetylmuramoyl-L-alanine amidase family protein [Opitutaceae bacterium]
MGTLTGNYRRAARLLALAAACLALGGIRAPAAPGRTRRVSYVSMIDVCRWLGLRFEFSANGRTMTIENREHRGVLLPPGRINAREMRLDGVRVFLGDSVRETGGRFFVSRTDYEKRLLPLFRPDLLRPRLRPPRLIVIDPGHGGIDPGAQNPAYRLQEKKLTLDVALRLRPLLEAQGWTVILTRTRDTQLSTSKLTDLEMRADIANRRHADLFLSIHFDADANPNVRGSEIMTFAPVGQRSTDGWGLREDDSLAEVSPGDRSVPWSNVLAHDLYRSLIRNLRTEDLGERIRHVAVLRYVDCPGALVEPVFISNAGEAARAAQPAFRERIAEALAAGLRDYAYELDRLNGRSAGLSPPRRP